MRFLFAAFFSLALVTCTNQQPPKDFDLQGHRGARGLLPENTIPAFLKAVDLGVDTIELDAVITADDKILVSHEPWFHHNISLKPDGTPVTEEEEMSLNIYEMTYEETRQFDVGMSEHPSFPKQQKINVQKPLLEDVIRAVENYVQEQEAEPVHYNIEIKSKPELYDLYYPQPDEFARLLNNLLINLDEEFDLAERTIIQSFDPTALAEFNEVNPDIKLSMLVSGDQNIQQYIDLLGFTPEIWSPSKNAVTPELIKEAHERNMKVIPWTVNTTHEMRSLLDMGVDGIITDYPDSAVTLRPSGM
ncbi:glycerophosphodiester phosphodiesterase family protein [Rhodohalobacter sp. 614A]|uniref:glycerophosphodiester phosphodiesterase family protein n=1 Tax=Rhodohalobacter sp. 614A TaxID=2908649 RepID=UPI001F2C01A5|nr:glycerophosphodiester phosphodiesterase family protein [Rhodohalobacter sp. 614A]